MVHTVCQGIVHQFVYRILVCYLPVDSTITQSRRIGVAPAVLLLSLGKSQPLQPVLYGCFRLARVVA